MQNTRKTEAVNVSTRTLSTGGSAASSPASSSRGDGGWEIPMEISSETVLRVQSVFPDTTFPPFGETPPSSPLTPVSPLSSLEDLAPPSPLSSPEMSPTRAAAPQIVNRTVSRDDFVVPGKSLVKPASPPMTKSPVPAAPTHPEAVRSRTASPAPAASPAGSPAPAAVPTTPQQPSIVTPQPVTVS